MGWEQRGTHQYYYRKEREGSRVKSIYVGRGEIAQMVSQIEASSPVLERIARAYKSPDIINFEKAEAALDETMDLIRSFTEATLLVAGFHTHHRQWRRTRHVV